MLDGFELVWDIFAEMHGEQNETAKYKNGIKVRYIGTAFSEFTNKEFVVICSNVQSVDSIEYLLEGFPYLVYEEELENINV